MSTVIFYFFSWRAKTSAMKCQNIYFDLIIWVSLCWRKVGLLVLCPSDKRIWLLTRKQTG